MAMSLPVRSFQYALIIINWPIIFPKNFCNPISALPKIAFNLSLSFFIFNSFSLPLTNASPVSFRTVWNNRFFSCRNYFTYINFSILYFVKWYQQQLSLVNQFAPGISTVWINHLINTIISLQSHRLYLISISSKALLEGYNLPFSQQSRFIGQSNCGDFRNEDPFCQLYSRRSSLQPASNLVPLSAALSFLAMNESAGPYEPSYPIVSYREKLFNCLPGYLTLHQYGFQNTPQKQHGLSRCLLKHTVKVPVCDHKKHMIKSPVQFVYVRVCGFFHFECICAFLAFCFQVSKTQIILKLNVFE